MLSGHRRNSCSFWNLQSSPWYISPPLQIRSKTLTETSTKKRKAEDEKILDTVKFLKECLGNHSRLVDIVLGRPEPLVKQGTELMQGLLSEVFGLDGPVLETTVEEVEDGVEEEVEEESEPEQESTPELESEGESESDSEVGFHDYMDIEVHEHPETESDAYDDNDGSSDHSDDSMVTTYKRKRTPRQKKQERVLVKEKHEKTLREKREKAREESKALYTRFGLTVERAEGHGTDTREDEHGNKRQKRNNDQPTALRQTTLNFDKVRKNRRLFSRKELSQSGMVEEKEEADHEQKPERAEEPDVVTRASYRRNPKRKARVPPGYWYELSKEIPSFESRFPRHRTGNSRRRIGD
jgi:hypothetical protein